MTSRIGDISAWVGHVVPGGMDPRYIRGEEVTLEGVGVASRQEQESVAQPQLQAKPIGDERHSVEIMQKLTQLIKGETSKPITESLPQHRDWR